MDALLRPLRGGVVAFLMVAAVATTVPEAASQTSTDPSTQQQLRAADVYPRAFFDRFYPLTALDILNRVPGFAVSAGEELRGFGGGAGNVLVDGVRPSVKSEGLEAFLSRIPADAVERVEVFRGAQRAGETAGQSLVANLVRSVTKRTAVRWFVEGEWAPQGNVYPWGEVSVAQRLGAWRTTSKVTALWERQELASGARTERDEDGELMQRIDEQIPATTAFVDLATELKGPAGGGDLTINGRARWRDEGRTADRLVFEAQSDEPDTADGRTTIRGDVQSWLGEVSIDWTESATRGWALKALALGTIEAVDSRTLTTELGSLETMSRRTTFDADQASLEVLSRATLGRVGPATWRPEFGVEVALNRLSSDFSSFVEDDDGRREVTLPAASVVVTEYRGEAFANLVWNLAPGLVFQGGLAAEISRLSVSGDAENARTFLFIKPSASLNYTILDALQLRTAVRRTVGQLDFADFAASAEAEDDRLLGGNPDLRPDQTLRLGFTVDLRDSDYGGLNLELFHEWTEDVLEQVILPSGASGLGNAGTARTFGVTGSASLRLDFVGLLLKGARVQGTFTIAESVVDDPITDESRVVTGFEFPDINLEFRQDLPEWRFAWGVFWFLPTDTEDYFTDEASFRRRTSGLEIYAETTRLLGVKFRAEVREITQRRFTRERRFFAPSRAGVFVGSETVEQLQGPFFELSVSGQL